MKWPIYILIVALASAWFALKFAELDERRHEFGARSFIEMLKVRPTTFINPVQREEEK